MAGQTSHAARHIRLAALALSAAFLLLAFTNLILVAEATPVVEPPVREGRQWITGDGASEQDGLHEWAFTVDPQGRRVVELRFAMPYTTRVTHVAGTADLVHDVSFEVDGKAVGSAHDVVHVEPRGNVSQRVSRTTSHNGDPGAEAGTIQVTRGDEQPFAVLVRWSWRLEASGDAEVDFRTTVRPVTVEPVDTPGLPGCGSTCARVLVGVALVAQVTTFAWYRSNGRAGRAGHGPDDEATKGRQL